MTLLGNVAQISTSLGIVIISFQCSQWLNNFKLALASKYFYAGFCRHYLTRLQVALLSSCCCAAPNIHGNILDPIPIRIVRFFGIGKNFCDGNNSLIIRTVLNFHTHNLNSGICGYDMVSGLNRTGKRQPLTTGGTNELAVGNKFFVFARARNNAIAELHKNIKPFLFNDTRRSIRFVSWFVGHSILGKGAFKSVTKIIRQFRPHINCIDMNSTNRPI